MSALPGIGAGAGLFHLGDRSPDAVNWANAGPGVTPQANADQTLQGFDGTITLRATLSAGAYGAGAKNLLVYKGGVLAGSVTAANGATLDVAVVSGNTIHYEGTKGVPGSGTSWNATITVTVLETGETLDTFTVSVDAEP